MNRILCGCYDAYISHVVRHLAHEIAGRRIVLNKMMAEENLVELWPDHPCIYDIRRSTEFKKETDVVD
jgi:hypothetical protein